MHSKLSVAAAILAAALACGCGAATRPADPPAGAIGTAGSQSSPGKSAPSPSPSPPAPPLAGRVIGIDPGHNGGNFSDPGYIGQLIWNGRESETCDTTGTEAASGFTEASFNFAVATDLSADLVAAGATVVMT